MCTKLVKLALDCKKDRGKDNVVLKQWLLLRPQVWSELCESTHWRVVCGLFFCVNQHHCTWNMSISAKSLWTDAECWSISNEAVNELEVLELWFFLEEPWEYHWKSRRQTVSLYLSICHNMLQPYMSHMYFVTSSLWQQIPAISSHGAYDGFMVTE